MKYLSNMKKVMGTLLIVFVVSISFNSFYSQDTLLDISSTAVDTQTADNLVKENINVNRERENTVIAENLANEKQSLRNRTRTETEIICGNLLLPDNYLSKFLFQDDLRYQNSKNKTRQIMDSTAVGKIAAKKLSSGGRYHSTRSYVGNRKAQRRQKISIGMV